LMKEHGSLSAVLQEREAYADDRYQQHLEAIREAVRLDEYHRFMRIAAEAKIEAWRTQSSNSRARV
jgi:Arc/MetJ-type ribon-helix-helix transcriptional regulator